MPAVLDLPHVKQLAEKRERAIVQAMEDRHHAVFYDVSYQTYHQLIEKYPERRDPRLTYDQGILEIMPLPQHDISERIIDAIVDIFAEALEIDFVNYGSSTQNRERLERGFESDSSFYFGEKAELMRFRERFLESDPPYDLVFEVDVTHSSILKLKLLATFGVAEVWIYEKKKLKILKLEKDSYLETTVSTVLPNVTSEVLNSCIEDSRTMSRLEWRKKMRKWAGENLAGQ